MINQARYRSDLDRRLFGSFLENLGRAVYTGVYEPGSPLADERGFRKDVIADIKGLNVPVIRYPGGNFVSGYNWLDGVGPKDQRPTVLERAWNSIETNQFGTNEFIDLCRLVNTEPLLGFSLGTGTPEMAVALVEYCNLERGTKWSDLRRAHGYEQPHNVRNWCLGNEMDGPWQMGHMPAREYSRKARDCARQIRVVDPDTRLIACGSSNTILPTYLVWDREVLEECYDQMPYLDVAGTIDAEHGEACVLMLNRDLESERELVLEWRNPTPSRVLACETLTGRDLKALNTFENPQVVVPHPLDAPQPGARMTFKLPPRSYTVAHFATS